MVIPLENRAYVLAVCDSAFIRTLGYIPSSTEKVYYKMFSLKVPKWLSAQDVAERLAEETDPEVVERLELKRVHVFTTDVEDAMTYRYEEINQEAEMLQRELPGRPSIIIEDLNQVWYPF